jgi:hypothetical protein
MANGHAIGMVKLHPRPSQLIEVRRLVGLTSVTLEHFLPNIIRKDKENVGAIRRMNPSGGKNQERDKCVFHFFIQTKPRHNGVSFF